MTPLLTLPAEWLQPREQLPLAISGEYAVVLQMMKARLSQLINTKLHSKKYKTLYL